VCRGEDLQLCLRGDDGANVAPLGDPAAIGYQPALPLDHRVANLGMQRNPRRRRGHLGRSDRLAHVLTVQGHPTSIESDLHGARDLAERGPVVEVRPGAERRQRDGAVHRSGVQVREAETLGERPRDSRLAGPRWAIDGNDHAPEDRVGRCEAGT